MIGPAAIIISCDQSAMAPTTYSDVESREHVAIR